jgi:hypothetical protein
MRKKPIQLTESDIIKIVAKVLNEQQVAPQQPNGECVRKGQFVKNCNKRYRQADPGLVVVGGDGSVAISQGKGVYTELSTAEYAYSIVDINQRTERNNAITMNAQGNRADANTLTFLLEENPQTLLSVINDPDCQKNRTVMFLKTVVKNFGNAQSFVAQVKAQPRLMNAENVEEVANTLVKPVTGAA